jgi:precorrin-3B synthase
LRVHAAADGGLARIRLPGGALTLDQLTALEAAARAFGDGHLELTSRANVQLRGLAPGDEGPLANALANAGLFPSATHERMRNIIASPLSGLDGRGLLDVAPLAAELDRELCARPALAELSGRFLFALDDGRGDVAGLRSDVALVADSPGTFAVLLGGADLGVRVPFQRGVDLAVAAAEAFLAERASSAWRVADLPDGPARVAATLGLTGGGATRKFVPLSHGPVGLVHQPTGGVTLAVTAPLSRLGPAQLAVLGRAALAGSGRLRITPWRGVVIPDLPADQGERWVAAASDAGFVTDQDSPWLGVTTCAGRPGCALALADVRADASSTLATAPPTGNGIIGVHWVGCEHRCGTPAGRVVEVLATGAGYAVSVDGRQWGLGTDPAEAIDAARRSS